MSEAWEIAIFWFAFAILSGWILRRFYFSKNAALIEYFRYIAFIIETITIGLFFFPWVPKARGGFSGWNLALHGNAGVTALLLLLIISAGLFLSRNLKFIIVGVASHIAANVLIFAVMIQILPETVQLGFHDVAPIIMALLLLTNTVVALLLWNQLQKQERYSK